jgi:hypothetical protein
MPIEWGDTPACGGESGHVYLHNTSKKSILANVYALAVDIAYRRSRRFLL